MRKPRKRPTKAQREQAAREEEAHNARIRAEHEASERAVKAREEEEARKVEAKAEEARRAAERIAEDERRERLAKEKAEREAIKKEIAELDLELAALEKAEYTTTFEWNLSIIDLIAKPCDEHHAKAKYLLTKLNELHEIIAKRKAERTVLEARDSKIGLNYDSLMAWIVGLASAGSAYWMARQWGSGKTADRGRVT